MPAAASVISSIDRPVWLEDVLMAKVALVSNSAWNLFNFRRPVIEALLARGDEVIAIAPEDGHGKNLTGLGCLFVDTKIDPQGFSVASDIGSLVNLKRIYTVHKPAVVLHFTIKPVIYGTLAARFSGIPAINTITGLGTAFIREGFLTKIVELLYRLALPGPRPVIFQNLDDLSLFRQKHLVTNNPCHVVPGSGIDLQEFPASPLPDGNSVNFLLIARLLRDKGIFEYVEAARQIRQSNPRVRFQILGPTGVANRTAIEKSQIEAWVRDGVIDYLGETDDVRPYIANADCVVLPSYREGMPRTLLEAAAMGRPLIATDVTGCRDVVDDGVNGYLCAPREAGDLALKIRDFIDLISAERQKMGTASREKAESQFDVKRVVDTYLDLIDAQIAGRD